MEQIEEGCGMWREKSYLYLYLEDEEEDERLSALQAGEVKYLRKTNSE